ncbi:MAG: hypothetical protein HY557_00975 [Euryarchaeota archaeon]|nr:hypothetical protein [Euryarchaeota archaeon]
MRVREVLGVWAPMLVGILLIAFAVNFLLRAPAGSGDPYFPLDPAAAAVCGGGVVAIGGILILSTYGRWRKVRAARRAGK